MSSADKTRFAKLDLLLAFGLGFVFARVLQSIDRLQGQPSPGPEAIDESLVLVTGRVREVSDDASLKQVSLCKMQRLAPTAPPHHIIKPGELEVDAEHHLSESTDDPYAKFAGPRERAQAIEELKQFFHKTREQDVLDQLPDLEKYGYSNDSTVNPRRLPDVVVCPRSTEQVQEIAKIATKWNIPIVAISGKSSLEGNCSAPHGGIAITFKNMDRIIDVFPDDRQAIVQPGVSWKTFNADVRVTAARLFFPVDPGPTAQFGGMVGTNCSGTNSVRYGTMRDQVINLTFVKSDGTVVKTRRRPAKSAAGYDLTRLLVGSEGTLGIVTEITIKLHSVPEETRVIVASFATTQKAVEASLALKQNGVDMQCIELMDKKQISVFNKSREPACREWHEADTLFIKLSGSSARMEHDSKISEQVLQKIGVLTLDAARSSEEAEQMWTTRKNSLWSMEKQSRKGDKPWSTDVAVPPSKLPVIIEWARGEMDRLQLFASILGHVGDGNFHCSIFYNPTTDYERVVKFNTDLIEQALLLEGTCTGEHGIGLGKKKSLWKEVGTQNLDVQRSIKRAYDPHWLLNPGKVFEPTAAHPIDQYHH